jgi:DNA-binding IclR family transcriptional regulator
MEIGRARDKSPGAAPGVLASREYSASPCDVGRDDQPCRYPTLEVFVAEDSNLGSGLRRCLSVIRALASADARGRRIVDIADAVALPAPTVHRILRGLIEEDIVEQDRRSKAYRLGMAFFEIASNAGNTTNLKTLCSPVLKRLSMTFGDPVFLLMRAGYDVVCLDRAEGSFEIRTFTGMIGGRTALGAGQGSLAILAYLPADEQEDILRTNAPRLKRLGVDEHGLRDELHLIANRGYAGCSSGPLPGVGAVACPIFNSARQPVAALSVGSISDRLEDQRIVALAEMLEREAEIVGRALPAFELFAAT